ncbi:hypothetical protein KPH14_001530 [Odynerus spinipes]|uniref:Myb-like domain-containing protein n=1 Tax=Odynerus spinipes TaxID=1348599 RepID=A0AAD9RUN9_9HYME|nr:hypothetical protein KPH14_001530 [Odynerus spinipes]
MRRARIKALATVPVRRKLSQNVVTTEPDNSNNNNKDNDEKIKSDITNEADIPITVCKEDRTEDESNSQEKIIVDETHEKKQDVEEKPNIQSDFIEQKSPPVTHLPEVTTTTINALGSPNKTTQSRSCFMRPVPRLSNSGRIRRNSIQGSGASASESEDDGKRVINSITNRTRNDSICSIQSNKEANTNTVSSNVSTKLKTGQKRRILMSESARKLAEARREFLLKHENKTPDRAKLTMYDLIYYNPVSNPMKKSESTTNQVESDSVSLIDEMEEEEREDDPTAMPVPQVKVGPDGQLIIDEQSLVIEQSHAKKSREVLAKKAIVDDDNYGTGFYKRRPKGKEWPKWETLKFYKALNIVGTDFLVMQTLFPNRTRREIKLKFKKEERMNRNLIEKVLECHQEFSAEKAEELARFEESVRKIFCADTKNEEKKKVKKKKKYWKYKLGFAARSLGTSIMTEEDEETEPEIISQTADKDGEANNNQCQQKTRKRSKSTVKRPDEATTEDKDACSTSEPESDSDAEIYQIRPTRSGRVPKVRKLQGPDVNNLHSTGTENSENSEEILENDKETTESLNVSNESVIDNEVYSEEIKSAIPNISEVEPGSVVILSKESPEEPGETVLEVYMVGSNVDTADNQIENVVATVKTSSEVLSTTPGVPDMELVVIQKNHEGDLL